MPETNGKPLLKSKTLWFNLAGLLATILTTAADILPPQYAALALAIGNFALRFATDSPLSFKL